MFIKIFIFLYLYTLLPISIISIILFKFSLSKIISADDIALFVLEIIEERSKPQVAEPLKGIRQFF